MNKRSIKPDHEKISLKDKAQGALSQGHWKEALEYFQKHSSQKPEDFRSRLKVAELLERLGTSMLHPTSAGMISTYSGKHSGFSMSIFNMGGTFAYGVGPLFITYLVSNYGLVVSPLTMLFGLVVMVILFKITPLPQQEPLRDLGLFDTLKEVLGSVWKSIVLIWVIMVLRALLLNRS
jgi:FSR family fosmidomycin resistance protein-like MFS transporter